MDAGRQFVRLGEGLQRLVHPVNDLGQDQSRLERGQILDDAGRLHVEHLGVHAVERDGTDGRHKVSDVVVCQTFLLRDHSAPDGFGVALSGKKTLQ